MTLNLLKHSSSIKAFLLFTTISLLITDNSFAGRRTATQDLPFVTSIVSPNRVGVSSATPSKTIIVSALGSINVPHLPYTELCGAVNLRRNYCYYQAKSICIQTDMNGQASFQLDFSAIISGMDTPGVIWVVDAYLYSATTGEVFNAPTSYDVTDVGYSSGSSK